MISTIITETFKVENIMFYYKLEVSMPERNVKKVVGKEVLMIGDLHFSDVFTGKHKNYLSNCSKILGQIVAKVQKEQPSAVVMLGDLVGWTETNIRDRQILAMFLRAFQDINVVCPIYVVRGNHDMKGFPEFNLLSQLGLIITSSQCGGYFDYYGTEDSEKAEIRFHIVDYKQEEIKLNLAEEGVSNVVLAHNNFTINGVTNWYAEHDGIELGMLQNFSGVDMVISGHIHNPSPEFVSAQMPDGNSCALFYAGCPTRPIKDKNMYNSVWWVKAEYNGIDTDINTEPWELDSYEDLFVSGEFIEEKTEEEIQDEVRKEALTEVLQDILQYRILGGDPIKQVMNIPNASEDAKQMAVNYLQIALNRGV